MVIQGKNYKLYEIYSQLAGSKENVIEEEFTKQGIDFSRIAFKEYRDKLVATHEGYAVEDHNGQEHEEDFCQDMYAIDHLNKKGRIDPEIGRVVDYSVPVKRCNPETNSDIEIGNISLVTETKDSVYLIGAKAKDSKESLLKTVMEIITYENMISRKRLVAEFNVAKTNRFKHYHTKNDIKPAILIFEGSTPYEEYMKLDRNSLAACIIKKYKIKFFLLESKEYGQYNLKSNNI